MLNKIKLVLNNTQLMKRIGFTLLILFVFKIATFIAIPMANTESMSEFMKTATFLEFLNTFSGGALGSFSIVALGISPYITASIVVQLLSMDIIPIFKEWTQQGEIGKQKLNQVTRYSALVLGFVQALILLFGLSGSNAANILAGNVVGQISKEFAYVYMALVMTAGSAFVMWLADLITRRGVGNGTSLIIVVGILTTLPTQAVAVWDQFITNRTSGVDILKFVIIALLYVLVLVGVVYSQLATRKIPIQYANRQGKTDSNIPLKLNSSNVIPVIFASTLMSIPTSIIGVMGLTPESSALAYWFDQIFTNTNIIGFILYVVLIYLFTFFYAFLMINPQNMADNLQKSNAYIPGVKPGTDTEAFIARLLFKVTIIGSTLLVLLAIIPIIVSAIFGLPSSVTIGGTGLLIVVGVALETVKQVETEANEQTYSGFIK